MVEDNLSVWQHIMQCTPPPERDEIAQLIGHKLIDQNKVSFYFDAIFALGSNLESHLCFRI